MTTIRIYDAARAHARSLDRLTAEVADALATIDCGRRLVGTVDIEGRVRDARDIGWAVPVDWLIEEINRHALGRAIGAA